MVWKNLLQHPPETGVVQTVFRLLLGAFLLFAGISHLVAQEEFLAQVPQWVPLDGELVVVLSGLVEIAFGGALIALPGYRALLGWLVAAFLVLVFPGNISQYVNGIDAFGLTTDFARGVRLFFQPLMIGWALWCTGAWQAWRNSKQD